MCKVYTYYTQTKTQLCSHAFQSGFITIEIPHCSSVHPEKIRGLWFKTSTFILMYKRRRYASVCAFLCWAKGKAQECKVVVSKGYLCFFSMQESAYFFFSLRLILFLINLALCELLNILRSVGVVFQKEKEVGY